MVGDDDRSSNGAVRRVDGVHLHHHCQSVHEDFIQLRALTREINMPLDLVGVGSRPVDISSEFPECSIPSLVPSHPCLGLVRCLIRGGGAMDSHSIRQQMGPCRALALVVWTVARIDSLLY